jgi:hypothetical protein
MIRLIRWLFGKQQPIININTTIEQNKPQENFRVIEVVNDVTNPDDTDFTIFINLAHIVTVYGISFESIDQTYVCIKLSDGEIYYAPGILEDILTKLNISSDDDDEDDDDEDDDEEPTTDDPPGITKEEWDSMLC